jgi:hypothetical protein
MNPDTPSTARMIDYWLGGTDHYDIDVAAAQAFESAYGPCAHEFRALRGFLARSVQYLHERGLEEFLVIGAGVPTLGNVHEVLSTARVLYTDIDPVTVEAGQRILAGNAQATYALGDATDLQTIDPTVLHSTLPSWGIGPVGVVFLGLAAFLDDEQLARALDDLYQATAPGSSLAFDFDSDVLAGNPEALAMMGPQFHMRRPEEFAGLLGRWQLTDEGIAVVADWPKPSPSDTVAAFFGGVATR